MGQVGLAGEHLEGRVHAGIRAGAEEEELVLGVVGLVEVGGEDEERAVEPLLDDHGEHEGARAPLSGGGDMSTVREAAGKLGDEVPELNKALRRAGSLEAVAKGSRDPEAALAYLQAAQQVIRVDED